MPDTPDGYGSIAGIYLLGDWAVKEGKALNKWGSDGPFTYEQSYHLDYTVAASKTLYVVMARGHVRHWLRGDADLSHPFQLQVQDVVGGVTGNLVTVTGDTDALVAFDPPHVVAGGDMARIYCTSFAEHLVYLYAYLRGYLL